MNSLLKRGVSGGNIMLRALAAAWSGKDARTFLSELSAERPELRLLDMNDLEGAARTLCAQRGIDFDSAMQSLKQSMGGLQ